MLCGNNGDSCWAKYGSYPLHRPYCHEMALRIVLSSLESAANRHKRHIVPVRPLSLAARSRDRVNTDGRLDSLPCLTSVPCPAVRI